jgi:hypothetical protein
MDALWSQSVERVLVYFVMVWATLAIMVGLGASELKKRSFWAWTILSLLTGPVAWYLLFFRLPVHIPPEKRTKCPHCGKTINLDAKSCPFCRKWVSRESVDRASEMGKQAATMVFAAKTLLGRARKAADKASTARRPAGGKAPPPTA